MVRELDIISFFDYIHVNIKIAYTIGCQYTISQLFNKINFL